MQALIMAAGKGSRLDSVSGGMPKPLIQIGPSWLIEHQLEMLSAEGIGPIAMVVGYRESEIREIVKRKVEYIQNPRWATTNSLYSFSLARKWVKGPVLVLNCDVLFHPDILDRLLRAKGNALAYDSSSGRGREQMKIKLEDGKLADMGKDMPHEEASGENVGILKFTHESIQVLFDEADRLLAAGEEKNWLGVAVKSICKTTAIHGVDVAGLDWAEIDFPYDLECARKEVWPAIEKNWKSKFRRSVTRWVSASFLLLAASLLLFMGLYSPTPLDWDTVDVTGGAKSKISLRGKKQKWWLFAKNDVIEFEGNGPETLRIETRLVLDKPAQKNIPYVLEILLDGKRIDWHKISTQASKGAKYKDLALGQKQRVVFEMPEGIHKLGVRLIAAEGTRSMIRFRQAEQPETE